MAVLLHLPSAFDRYKREGEIIGRMVIEYGEMEWDFCLLVAAIIGDLDSALKAMYRSRGETQRIDVGDALARNRLPLGRLRTIYEQTVAHMRICLKIRNQYAHTNWVETASDGLAFLNIEEIAGSDAKADTANLQLYGISMEILEDQQRFFVGVLQNLRYLNLEVQNSRGVSKLTGFHYISPLARPQLAERITR